VPPPAAAADDAAADDAEADSGSDESGSDAAVATVGGSAFVRSADKKFGDAAAEPAAPAGANPFALAFDPAAEARAASLRLRLMRLRCACGCCTHFRAV
jgi:hypothetical protein